MLITTSMDDHDEEKRTEQSLFVRSGKSEAEVTNNRRLRSTYCTIEANDRHEASRGLSVTAGLLVYKNRHQLQQILILSLTVRRHDASCH